MEEHHNHHHLFYPPLISPTASLRPFYSPYYTFIQVDPFIYLTFSYIKMRYSIILSASLATYVSGHGLVVSMNGANGVTMPGLSVADGTPRDCSSKYAF